MATKQDSNSQRRSSKLVAPAMLRKLVESPRQLLIDERPAWLLPTLGILGLPIILFFVYPIAPTYQSIGGLDAFIYTGYINNFSDLLSRYGFTYYSVRFGLILPGFVLTKLFGSVAGFYVLRYLFTVGAGLMLFRCLRRNLGTEYAVTGIVFLLSTPLWYRTLLWDHPDAAGVPYLVMGIAAVFTPQVHRIALRAAAAGVFFALAIHSNFFTLSITAFAGLAALVFHWHRIREFIRVEVPIMATSAAVVHLVGAAIYYSLIGRWDIHRPSIDISTSLATGLSRNWLPADHSWLLRFLDIYLLPFMLLTLAVTYKQWISCTFSRAVALFSLLCCSFYYYWQFLHPYGGNILSLFYYSSYLIPALGLTFVVVLHTFFNKAVLWQRRLVLWGLNLMMLAFPLLYTNTNIRIIEFKVLVVWASIAIVGAMLVKKFPHGKLVVAPLWTCVVVALIYVAPYNSWKNQNLAANLDLYRLASQFSTSAPPKREWNDHIRFWYPNKHPLINSMQSTFLWGFSRVHSPSSDVVGLPVLGNSELEFLNAPDLRYVMLIGVDQNEVDDGLESLKDAIPEAELLGRREFQSGELSCQTALVELPRSTARK